MAVQLLDWRLCGAAPGRLVSPTSVGRVSSVVSLDATRVSLFIDADHFRRCAVAGHEHLTRQSASPSRVNIDGPAVSEWVDQAAVDLGLREASETSSPPSPRRIYDILNTDRARRWRQRHHHGVLAAEGFVVTSARVRCAERLHARAGLDLVQLTQSRNIDAALLLVGDGAYADAVATARRHGAHVVLLVPPVSSVLVADSLRAAASRIVALHPEVFETLYHVLTDKRRGPDRS